MAAWSMTPKTGCLLPLSGSENLSPWCLQDACRRTGTEVLRRCRSSVDPLISWDCTLCAHQVWKRRLFVVLSTKEVVFLHFKKFFAYNDTSLCHGGLISS